MQVAVDVSPVRSGAVVVCGCRVFLPLGTLFGVGSKAAGVRLRSVVTSRSCPPQGERRTQRNKRSLSARRRDVWHLVLACTTIHRLDWPCRRNFMVHPQRVHRLRHTTLIMPSASTTLAFPCGEPKITSLAGLFSLSLCSFHI